MTKKTIQDNFDAIQTTASRRIFDILAEEGNNKHTVKAFDFLFNVYSALFEKIKQDSESFIGIDFYLFDEVSPLLYQRMKDLPFQESQAKLHLGPTISIALWIAVLSKKQDASHIRDFVWKISSDYMPYRTNKGEICYEAYWGRLYHLWDFVEFYKMPECRQKLYAGQSNGLMFDHFYGLLVGNKKQAIIEGFYGAFVPDIFNGGNGGNGGYPLLVRYKVLAALAMHILLLRIVLNSANDAAGTTAGDIITNGVSGTTTGAINASGASMGDTSTGEHLLRLHNTARAILSDVKVRENFSRLLNSLIISFTLWYQDKKQDKKDAYIFDNEIDNELDVFLSAYTGYTSMATIKNREIFLFIIGYIASKNKTRYIEENFITILSSILEPIKYTDCFRDSLKEYIEQLFAKLWLAIDYKRNAEKLIDKQIKQTEQVDSINEESTQKQYKIPDDIAIIDGIDDSDKREAIEHGKAIYRMLKSWLTEQEVQKRLKDQEIFCNSFDEQGFCRNIEEKVEERLKSVFWYLIPKTQEDNKNTKNTKNTKDNKDSTSILQGEDTITIDCKELLSPIIPIDALLSLLSDKKESLINAFSLSVSTGFLNSICDKLLEKKAIKEIIRASIGDQAYLDQLQLENIDFLIGAESLFRVKDFNYWQRFKKFKDKFKDRHEEHNEEHIVALPSCCYALAIKEASPALGDIKPLEITSLKIHANMRTPNAEDIESEIKNNIPHTDDGTYRYQLYANEDVFLQFSKDGIYKFLESKDKIVTVSVCVSIKKNMDDVGFILR